jgi:hypothetical protein
MTLKKEVGSFSKVPVIFTIFDTENEQLMIKAENLIGNIE